MKKLFIAAVVFLVTGLSAVADPGPTKMVNDKECLALIQAQLKDDGRDPADFSITFENSDVNVAQTGDLVVYNKYLVKDNETNGVAELTVALVIHVTAQDEKPAPSPTPKKTKISF